MKIIGKTERGFILEASGYEIANLLGYHSDYSNECPSLGVGTEIEISGLYTAYHNVIKNKKRIKEINKFADEIIETLKKVEPLIRAQVKQAKERDD